MQNAHRKTAEARAKTTCAPLTGRFAPSPTGRMHAGNIYCALIAWIVARRSGGEVVLRIEDLDPERSKPVFTETLLRDFAYLGLTWDRGPFFQSDRTEAYADAFRMLEKKGLVYPCYCTRADVHAASAPHTGENTVYQGLCRNQHSEDYQARKQRARQAGRAPAWRLTVPDKTIEFEDAFQGNYRQNLAMECGDFIVRRSDGAFAYQLAVVLDDAEQNVTSVVRGADLLSSTPQQIYLQHLLGLDTPAYGHVPLLTTASGRRLSKRDADASIDVLQSRYKTPEGILGHIAFATGLIPEDTPASACELLDTADVHALRDLGRIIW